MELPDFKKLQKLITFCRKNRISHVKFGDFEFDIEAKGQEVPSAYKRKKAQITPEEQITQEGPKYSDLDVLLWSSAGIPDSQDEVANG